MDQGLEKRASEKNSCSNRSRSDHGKERKEKHDQVLSLYFFLSGQVRGRRRRRGDWLAGSSEAAFGLAGSAGSSEEKEKRSLQAKNIAGKNFLLVPKTGSFRT